MGLTVDPETEMVKSVMAWGFSVGGGREAEAELGDCRWECVGIILAYDQSIGGLKEMSRPDSSLGNGMLTFPKTSAMIICYGYMHPGTFRRLPRQRERYRLSERKQNQNCGGYKGSFLYLIGQIKMEPDAFQLNPIIRGNRIKALHLLPRI